LRAAKKAIALGVSLVHLTLAPNALSVVRTGDPPGAADGVVWFPSSMTAVVPRSEAGAGGT
jgi:hypothetical protein